MVESLLSTEQLIRQVRAWGRDRGIIDHGTARAQAIKTLEETTELLSAVDAEDYGEIRDAIGDTLVTLIIQADMQGMDIHDCLRYAYQQIAVREGRMINGQFIKNN